MMAAKAKLFEDQEILEQILKCDDPKQIKALGRKVKGLTRRCGMTLNMLLCSTETGVNSARTSHSGSFCSLPGMMYW